MRKWKAGLAQGVCIGRNGRSPENCAIDVEEHWRAANPGLESGIKSINYMQDASDRAKSSPGNEMHFRAYDLNQRVDPAREVIVSVTDYSKCVQDYPPEMAGNICSRH